MRLRPDTLAQLQGMFPDLDVARIRIQVGLPWNGPGARLPCAIAVGELETAAVSQPGVVYLSPKYAQDGTRGFLALMTHELVHQQQYRTIPGFLSLYQAEQSRVEAGGLPPWANRYEAPAYQLQWQIEGRRWAQP